MLYLLRHADALDAEENPARPLSSRGRAQVAQLARFLQHNGAFRPEEIWHSPLLRARETAQMLAQHLNIGLPLQEMPDLQPEDDPAATARRLQKLGRPLAVCGHEPHLSSLATLLIAGRNAPPAFVMKKCSMMALESHGAHWMVRWHLFPELLS